MIIRFLSTFILLVIKPSSDEVEVQNKNGHPQKIEHAHMKLQNNVVL
jgi:hypothetical protein